MSREGWLRVAGLLALVVFTVAALAVLILFVWNKTFHDAFGWSQIDYLDALGWSVLISLIYSAIYLLKEDLK